MGQEYHIIYSFAPARRLLAPNYQGQQSQLHLVDLPTCWLEEQILLNDDGFLVFLTFPNICAPPVPLPISSLLRTLFIGPCPVFPTNVPVGQRFLLKKKGRKQNDQKGRAKYQKMVRSNLSITTTEVISNCPRHPCHFSMKVKTWSPRPGQVRSIPSIKIPATKTRRKGKRDEQERSIDGAIRRLGWDGQARQGRQKMPIGMVYKIETI